MINLSYPLASLHVETSGPEDAAPVVLLHGWGSRAELMRPLAAHLAGRFRVYNVDLPGHGASPEPPAPWGVPEYAALVRQLIEERVQTADWVPTGTPEPGTSKPNSATSDSAPPVTLVGHSNGGRLALYLAAEPETAPLLRRLVLISPSGIAPRRSRSVALRSGLARALKAPFEALPEPLRGYGLDWLRHSLLWKALGSSDYRQLRGVMRETFVKTVTFHLDDRVHRVAVPTLLFWGEADTAVSRRQMQVLEDQIPDAGLVTLERAGHYGYLDAPVPFYAALDYFLEHS